MNKKSIYFGTLVLTALTLGSCASDDTATEKTAGKDTPKSGTVFSSETEPATRTSATYTGSGLDFYWTASDKIWVKDDNGNYNQSASDDISSRIAAVPGSTTTDKAKFWVNGSYTGSTHKVRYTGKNGTKDKVTIKASQTQNTPNDAVHIADDGDFGVADATGSGAYNFTLNHKAAYVTFMPYNANGVIPGAKIQKIRVYTGNTSDQLAGTFDLADNGTLSNGTTTSNSVELNVNDFTLPSAYSYTTNGATMVLNPGTYSNVTIEYTLYDAVTNVTGVIEKIYPSVTFDAGKNTPVRADLRIKIYSGNDYYQWDAQQNYWAGYEWNSANPKQPTLNGESNVTDAPQSTFTVSAHSSRDFNDIMGYNDYSGTSPAVMPTTNKFKSCANLNELLWYAKEGDPHWDGITLWATMDHLYKGGMWLKKKDHISGFSSSHAPDGIDKTTAMAQISYLKSRDEGKTILQGKPSNLSEYFYLPALGGYLHDGSTPGHLLGLGEAVSFWSSTTMFANQYGSYAFLCDPSDIRIDNTLRVYGYRLWSPSQEDSYRPF